VCCKYLVILTSLEIVQWKIARDAVWISDKISKDDPPIAKFAFACNILICEKSNFD
jgi:hypothetical protein